MQVLPCRSIGEGRAHARAHGQIAIRGLRRLAVLAPARIAVVVEAAPSRDAVTRLNGRGGPLPDIARHVVHAERTPRGGVQTDRVGPEGEGFLPVRLVEVGV